MFNFTNDCFTGIVNVDNKRLEYFEILNYALNNDSLDSNLLKIRNIIDKLSIYSSEGFREEEEYMTETVDKELEIQTKEHRWFIEKLDEFKKNAEEITDENSKDELNKIIRFMIRWLYSHIVSKDTLISKPVMVSDNKTDTQAVHLQRNML